MKNLKIWSCEMMQNTNELEIVQKLLDNHLFNEKKGISPELQRIIRIIQYSNS